MERSLPLIQRLKARVDQEEDQCIERDAHLCRLGLQPLILLLREAEAGLDFTHSPHSSLHIVIKSAIINM